MAGVEYPETYNGHNLGPARGESLVPSFSGKARPEHEFLYQNFSNSKTALVQGKWKLVDQKYLCNLERDRIESDDLSQSHPEMFKRMQAEFIRLDEELNDGGVRQKVRQKRKGKKPK